MVSKVYLNFDVDIDEKVRKACWQIGKDPLYCFYELDDDGFFIRFEDQQQAVLFRLYLEQ